MIKNARLLILGVIVAALALSFYNAWMSRRDDNRSLASWQNDIQAVQLSRNALSGIVQFMSSRTDLFPASTLAEPRILNQEQRDEVLSTWTAFLDHLLALDSLGQAYSDTYREASGFQKKVAFHISYAIFLAQYRHALDFIALAENDPSLHIVLNEPLPGIGLPERSYAQVKYRFLNILRGAEFARMNVVSEIYGSIPKFELTWGIHRDADRIWVAGKGEGPINTAKNALQIVEDTAVTAWFPVQKGVSQKMSEIKVLRQHESLISQAQIQRLTASMQPGDIMLQRREWYMTNVGLPGFWTHAALYVGNAQQRAAYFADGDVRAWLANQGLPDNFEAALKTSSPEAYRSAAIPAGNGHSRTVLEALGEGVIFTAMSESAAADSVVVLRPRLDKVAKARALLRAYSYAGRPYDFNFDFRSEEALVCTELVYKAYQPDSSGHGLTLPLSTVLGRTVTSANDIARLFAAELDTAAQQFELVRFLDGYEGLGKSRLADVRAFADSWMRPKWHVLVQEIPRDN